MLIWVKRLIPFVIIAAAVFVYLEYERKQDEKRALEENRHALVTAQIWVASARYRANPEQYLKVRDSLLAAASMSADDLRAFINADTGQPENLTPYMNLVQEYLDSLLDIEDSIRMAREDSLAGAAGAIR